MSPAGTLWRAAATLAAPVLPLWLAGRARRGKEFSARLPERRGIATIARPPGRLLWLHAASVGETQSVLPLIARLRAARPELAVLLTTGTVTSARLLPGRLGAAGADPERSGLLPGHPWLIHQFAPLD
uniref:3-deoxy-D-manno-octulosonic acid transferase n=1 Tax=Elioraea sp. TaxID=2185103 RepID=UPI003F6F9F91